MSGFLKDECVLIISAVLAFATLFINDDPMSSLKNIDIRTLCILFCFMAAVAVMTECGAFERLGSALVSGSGNMRMLCMILVLLPFVCSMFITNDVSLITFVPLSMTILAELGKKNLMIPVIVLQTAAANLGSIITPFGNPQNLFIFSRYNLSLMDFIETLMPLFVVGTLIILAVTSVIGGSERVDARMESAEIRRKPVLAVSCILFAVCIMTVLRTVPYQITLAVVLVMTAAMMPKALRKVDYSLLLTFVFLFVFTGNLSSNTFVSEALGNLMDRSPELTSVVASQFMSNVPAAVLLSGFTDDWAGLLSGVDIGGFGTPIASMASLISLKLYMGTEGADMKRFLMMFAGINVLMLMSLLATSLLI